MVYFRKEGTPVRCPITGLNILELVSVQCRVNVYFLFPLFLPRCAELPPLGLRLEAVLLF